MRTVGVQKYLQVFKTPGLVNRTLSYRNLCSSKEDPSSTYIVSKPTVRRAGRLPERWTDGLTDRKMSRQIDRQRKACWWTDWKTERMTDNQTARPTDGLTFRRLNRQADRLKVSLE